MPGYWSFESLCRWDFRIIGHQLWPQKCFWSLFIRTRESTKRDERRLWELDQKHSWEVYFRHASKKSINCSCWLLGRDSWDCCYKYWPWKRLWTSHGYAQFDWVLPSRRDFTFNNSFLLWDHSEAHPSPLHWVACRPTKRQDQESWRSLFDKANWLQIDRTRQNERIFCRDYKENVKLPWRRLGQWS